MTVHSPSASDSPHLGGIQPTWRDLPFACEIVAAVHDSQDESFETLKDGFVDAGGKSKTDQMINFLGKMRALGGDGEMLPNGVFLAEAYTPPDQEAFGNSVRPGLKTRLWSSEQFIWKTLLFERDWLPMLATVNILATREVPTNETDSRAKEFQDRLNHLDKYQSFDSINTWKKKAQTHFGWTACTGLATGGEHEQYELTDVGRNLHENVREHYHPDWPSAIRK